jgi:hypothetical protein
MRHKMETPIVTLGGRGFPVPELAPRQLRQIRSALIEFNNLLRKSPDGAAISLSDDQYDRLLLKPVYIGLTRGTPDLKPEEFDDLPISETELITAWFTVRRQSGLFVTVEKSGAGASEPGEAQAA